MLPKNKHYREESVFKPENLLREARRQKRLGDCMIPEVCILDPDGDIVKYLRKKRLLLKSKCWACYHTELYTFKYRNQEFGIVGCVVGSSFAVLVAEELFVSGCRLLISITSAGGIEMLHNSTRFMLIEKAIRDEGTSSHYLKHSLFSSINKRLLSGIMKVLPDIKKGITWTTDGPFRETKSKIEYAKSKGAIAVEMEASALYAFAEARKKKVVCIAHITNSMGQTENDFEKGPEKGSINSLDITCRITKILKKRRIGAF
ncbi:MAG: hypothetical protein A3J83_09215 [Elusimicrobia bacterium RIFOXYA2_FULL_40_6]|nr:MAG: hypothetical protein A3J83_09215 [Elusimicrobia bacterium RIFOXYA2_FULL_40_6]